MSTHEGKKDRIDKSNANTAVWVGFLVLPKHEVKMPQTWFEFFTKNICQNLLEVCKMLSNITILEIIADSKYESAKFFSSIDPEKLYGSIEDDY